MHLKNWLRDISLFFLTRLNECGYYSAEEHAAVTRDTRFFFADAAAAGFVKSKLTESPELYEKSWSYIKAMNPVFCAIVLTYLNRFN